ncbi:MAG: hypothetical protein HC886_17075 [Leptolyngbyaceae cyanobacterium SM1_1_3]|nr:hypothetical protein [Leptolyngbyaceae cyanobacterium SM1_1_3]
MGAWDEATAAVDQAIVLLHLSSSPPAPASVVAQVLDVQGKLQFDRGEVNAALATWQHTAELYQDLGDIQRLALSYINQAQALQALGLYRRVLAV